MKAICLISLGVLLVSSATAQTNFTAAPSKPPTDQGVPAKTLDVRSREAVESPFSLPDPLVTLKGKRYESVKLVRAYPSELCIRYRGPGNELLLENVKLSDLSQDLQKHFQYDPKKAQEYDAKERERSAKLKGSASPDPSEMRWRDFNSVMDRRIDEVKEEIRQAKIQEKIYQDSLKERQVQAQEDQARAATIQALNPATVNVQVETKVIRP